MQKGNVNRAFKILTNNMSGSILHLTDEILQLVKLNLLMQKTTPTGIAKTTNTNNLSNYI